MIVTKAHLSRRTVLRGLGVSLALPLLDSMVPAMTALGQTAAAPVRRLGVFYVPNGMSMPYWWPKTEGPLKELPPTLQSLAAHKDKVLLCGGLADEAANLVKGGGDHARSAGTFLTCVPFKITAGAEHVSTFNRTERSYRKWCSRCGGHLFTDHPGMGLVDVYAAVLPTLPFVPAFHIHYGETKLRVRDGLPKFKNMPREVGGTGELLPE